MASSILAVIFCLGGLSLQAQAASFLKGDVFAAVNNGNVDWYRADGTFVMTLNDGVTSGFTTGMAFDTAGNLYVTMFSASQVNRYNSSGAFVGTFGSGYSVPEALVFDASGNMYSTSVGGLGIQKFSSTGASLGSSLNGTRTDWMDLKADQKTMLWTDESGVIHTVDVSTGIAGPNFANAGGQFALRILGDGGLLVASQAAINRFDAAGNLIRSYDFAGQDGWFALNLDPDGTSFWSGDFNTGQLHKFDIVTGNHLQTLDTHVGGSSLFGVAVFGEITQGCPECGNVPEPATLALLGLGLAGVAAVARWRRNRM